MKRIVVTGGAGFIGSTFVHHILHAAGEVKDHRCCPDQHAYSPCPELHGVRILNLDRMTYAADPRNLEGVTGSASHELARIDICDAAAVDAALRAFEPDAIVHFAAESHVDRSIEAGEVFVRTNVLGTQVLLDAARRHDVGRFLHVGTDEVYGSLEAGSARQEDPLRPSSPYAASKAASDLLVLAHHHTYGLQVLVTRCTNNYGPRQHAEKLLPKAITLAMAHQRIPVYGDGLHVRDWLYVKDHAEAIRHVLFHGKPGSVHHVAGQDERPNLEVLKQVLKTMERPEALLEHVRDRPGHDRRYSLDDRSLRASGWRPRIPFHQGLAFTIRWLRDRAGGA